MTVSIDTIRDGLFYCLCRQEFVGPHGYPVMCWPCHRASARVFQRKVRRAIHLEKAPVAIGPGLMKGSDNGGETEGETKQTSGHGPESHP